MQFLTSALVVISLCLSATAVTSPSIARNIHARRCGAPSAVSSSAVAVPSSSPAASSPAASSPAASSPAPSASPVSDAPSGGNGGGNNFLAGTNVGQGTWYATGLGSCGITNTDSDHIVAVSQILYDQYPGYSGANPNNNPVCNKKINATYQGKSVTVTVTDRCTGCKETDLDFSPSAFSELADQGVGRLDGVKWTWA